MTLRWFHNEAARSECEDWPSPCGGHKNVNTAEDGAQVLVCEECGGEGTLRLHTEATGHTRFRVKQDGAQVLLRRVDKIEEWFHNTGIRPARKEELEAWNWVATNFAKEMRAAIEAEAKIVPVDEPSQDDEDDAWCPICLKTKPWRHIAEHLSSRSDEPSQVAALAALQRSNERLKWAEDTLAELRAALEQIARGETSTPMALAVAALANSQPKQVETGDPRPYGNGKDDPLW